jgi:hypothetical protein
MFNVMCDVNLLGVSNYIIDRLSQFISFYESLPRQMMNQFTNKFPVANAIPWKHREETIEKKRVVLEEWLRELCMSEACMSDKAILRSLEEFVDVHDEDEAAQSPVRPPGEPAIVRLTDYRDDWVTVPDRVITKIPGD